MTGLRGFVWVISGGSRGRTTLSNAEFAENCAPFYKAGGRPGIVIGDSGQVRTIDLHRLLKYE